MQRRDRCWSWERWPGAGGSCHLTAADVAVSGSLDTWVGGVYKCRHVEAEVGAELRSEAGDDPSAGAGLLQDKAGPRVGRAAVADTKAGAIAQAGAGSHKDEAAAAVAAAVGEDVDAHTAGAAGAVGDAVDRFGSGVSAPCSLGSRVQLPHGGRGELAAGSGDHSAARNAWPS